MVVLSPNVHLCNHVTDHFAIFFDILPRSFLLDFASTMRSRHCSPRPSSSVTRVDIVHHSRPHRRRSPRSSSRSRRRLRSRSPVHVPRTHYHSPQHQPPTVPQPRRTRPRCRSCATQTEFSSSPTASSPVRSPSASSGPATPSPALSSPTPPVPTSHPWSPSHDRRHLTTPRLPAPPSRSINLLSKLTRAGDFIPTLRVTVSYSIPSLPVNAIQEARDLISFLERLSPPFSSSPPRQRTPSVTSRTSKRSFTST